MDWSAQRIDNGEIETFSLQPNFSGITRRISRRPTTTISEDDVLNCLQIHSSLCRFPELELPVARWLRSKRSPATHEQLIELRIALESALLHGDNEGEKCYRLAIRGAWLVAKTPDERKTHYHALRDVYNYASKVIHGGNPKVKQGQDLSKLISDVQDICRDAILSLARNGKQPDWTDLTLGRNVLEQSPRLLDSASSKEIYREK